jgi:hypothetical protein
VRLGGVQLQLKTQGRDRQITDTLMTLRLPEPLASGAKVTLEIDYAFTVPEAGTAPRMGHENDNVYYLGYWYPQFAVCDDVNGWVADQHRGNGEFYMDYADYDLAITAPVGYLVRATGELQNADEVLTQKARDALAAASTNHEIVHVVDKEDLAAGNATAKAESGKLCWRFRAENVRDAAVSIAKTYLWDATHAIIADKQGAGVNGKAMIHAVYEANATEWVRAARFVQHTIEYMSAHVHPYPWPHMTACEGIIGGGMEYPMMTICGSRGAAGTIAHETIHMWFPMLLGSNEKRYAWQDEGFTSFWTTLCRGDFTGVKNGPLRAILRYADNVSRGGDVSCMRHADTYGSEDFGFASYDKPEVILHQLRAMLGDDTFFAAFRRYAADWAWKHPYPHDFFRTFSDVARLDLEPVLPHLVLRDVAARPRRRQRREQGRQDAGHDRGPRTRRASGRRRGHLRRRTQGTPDRGRRYVVDEHTRGVDVRTRRGRGADRPRHRLAGLQSQEQRLVEAEVSHAAVLCGLTSA